MKRIGSFFLITYFLVASNFAFSKDLSGYKTYSGMYSFSPKIAGNFFKKKIKTIKKISSNSNTTHKYDVPNYQIIHNKNEFKKFIANIPKKKMTKKSPAPASNDPLLKTPKIDFKKYNLVPIFSHSENYFVQMKIRKVEIKNSSLYIYFDKIYPPKNHTVSKISGFGNYTAILVPVLKGGVHLIVNEIHG